MTDAPRLTPMMERYLAVKRENPGTLLLFRMGDFYELFHDDAEVAAKLLGLTLTSRDKGSSNPVPMAGFPFHALQPQLQKLIKAGLRVAICEQVEDPKQAKGLVKREVTQVVTPGTLVDENLLDPRENNFLAALFLEKAVFEKGGLETGRLEKGSLEKGGGEKPGRDETTKPAGIVGLAWIDVSTGRFVAAELEPAQLADEFARLAPAECLISEAQADWLKIDGNAVLAAIAAKNGSEKSKREGETGSAPAPLRTALTGGRTVWTTRPPWSFGREATLRLLREHFGTGTLEGFDLESDSPAVVAAGALLEYVQETQKSALGHITRIEPYRRNANLTIDEATRRSLELTRTMRENVRDGSLLDVLDETVTPMGARLTAEWLSGPLTEVTAINARLDAVAELTGDPLFCRSLREQLEKAYDLERLTGRIATRRAGPRDLVCLAKTLALLPGLKAKLLGRKSSLLGELESRLALCPEARAAIESAIDDDPPINVTDGGVIRGGFNADLDELRELARGGKAWIAKYQAQEIERTGIPSLKVGFNKVFGYYLEVTATHKAKVPSDYIRKQTLKNQERFITPELKEYEDKVLRAEERAIALEQQLFEDLKEQLVSQVPKLQQTAAVLATLDGLGGLATVAASAGWCRPKLVAQPVLDIREGRHPVLDRKMPAGVFVPNDIRLGPSEGEPHGRLQIITGPNMAGKSTYIRQAALITILAQMGSFVPAKSAVVGVADRVFARVGASDELGKGQSTFMVEMTETARILNAATENSLVILDEIGRGTSTYDGVSLAWAVTEYLHDVIRCRTLFATHYHELTDLTGTLKQAENWNVAVREDRGEIIFLHKIIPGGTNKSYGLHVAKLAGVPPLVIDRARTILASLENEHLDAGGRPKVPARRTRQGEKQLALFDPGHPVLERLRELDLNDMTPLHALQELHRLREEMNQR